MQEPFGYISVYLQHLHTHQLNIPLDSLESTAGHVDDASGGSGYCTHQTFSKPFKEAGCALPLSSCRPTLAPVRGTAPEHHQRRAAGHVIPLIGLVTIPVIPLTKP